MLCLWGIAAVIVLLLWRIGPNRRLSSYSAPNVENLPVNVRLMNAIGKGDIGTVRALLDHGALPNSCERSEEGGTTALASAASIGRLDIVQLLLARGANVNATDFWGGNATTEAATTGHPEVLQCLIDHGGDVNADDDGATALDFLEANKAQTPDQAERYKQCLDEIRAAGGRLDSILEMMIFGFAFALLTLFVITASVLILICKPEKPVLPAES